MLSSYMQFAPRENLSKTIDGNGILKWDYLQPRYEDAVLFYCVRTPITNETKLISCLAAHEKNPITPDT